MTSDTQVSTASDNPKALYVFYDDFGGEGAFACVEVVEYVSNGDGAWLADCVWLVPGTYVT